MYFLGVDGGSTKTEFLLADEAGKVYSHRSFGGCNYGHLGGAKQFEDFFRDCIGQVAADAGISIEDITYTMVGLPAYQELEETEETIPAAFANILGQGRFWVANDTVPGWAGCLGAVPGIHIVAGTGSIAYGMDEKGNSCRVGGWSLLLADEGSASWIGLKVINTFFRQADGRLPRTALYDIVREHFGITHDLYFTGEVNRDFDTSRNRFAKAQLLAEKAYLAGDQTMAKLYADAAEELADHARTVRANLDFDTGRPVKVSYFGGVFKAGDVIMKPFTRKLQELDFELVAPKYPPYIGAVALAARGHVSPQQLADMQAAIAASEQK